jgi:hypothetical protein
LPNEVNTILNLLKLGQQAMFGFFMTGIILNFLLLLATPLVLRSRLWSIPVSIVGGISGTFITAAAIIASIMSLGAKFALTKQEELNIRADIGVQMFAFMWIAAGLTDLAFLIHAAMGCFCHIHRQEVVTAVTSTAEPADRAGTPEDKKTMVDRVSFFRKRRKVAGSA